MSRRFGSGRHTVHGRAFGNVVEIIAVRFPVRCLRDALEKGKGVRSLLQAHFVGIRRDRHDVDDAVVISGLPQVLHDLIHGILICPDHNHRHGVKDSFTADIRQIQGVADGAEDGVIQACVLVSDGKHARDTVVHPAGLMLCEHDVVNKRIVLAFAGQRCDKDDYLVLTELVFPATWRKIGVGRRVFDRGIVIGGGDFIWPAKLLRAQRGVLLRRCRKAENDVRRTCVVAETAQQSAGGSFLHCVQLPVNALLDIERVLLQQRLQHLRVRRFRRKGNRTHAKRKHKDQKNSNCLFHWNSPSLFDFDWKSC